MESFFQIEFPDFDGEITDTVQVPSHDGVCAAILHALADRIGEDEYMERYEFHRETQKLKKQRNWTETQRKVYFQSNKHEYTILRPTTVEGAVRMYHEYYGVEPRIEEFHSLHK